MSCHKLAPRNLILTFTAFILLHSCLQFVSVNAAVDGIFCELLNISVSQRWIGNTLLVTSESRAIQDNLKNNVGLASPNSEHWSCFETETTTGILGTPGGDTSEFLLALTILFKDSPLLQTPTVPTTPLAPPIPPPTPSQSTIPPAPINQTIPLPVETLNITEIVSTTLVGDNTTVSVATTFSSPNPTIVSNSTSNSSSILNSIASVASEIKSNLTSLINATSTTTATSTFNQTVNQTVTALPTWSNNSTNWTNIATPSTLIVSPSPLPTTTSTNTTNTTSPPNASENPILNQALFNRIHEIFNEFIKVNVSALRRFYYHSDYDIVERMRKEIGVRNGDLFYDQQTPEQQRQSLQMVIKPENIGCRHLRLTLEHPEWYQTPKILTQTFIQVLHDYLWNYNNGTFLSRFYIDLAKRTHPKEFAHLNVSINVEAHPDEDNEYDQTEGAMNPCYRVQPTVPTLIGNQSYFVVQHRGIALFRQELADYMASLPESKVKDSKEYYKQIDDLAGKQWALSQSNIGPDLKTFDVVVSTKNRTSEVVEQTWLFIGVGVIAAAILSYLLWIYWKKRRQQQQQRERLFDEETPAPNLSSPGEKYPIRTDNPTYSK